MAIDRHIKFRKSKTAGPVKKVLIIRLQATGDVVIMLPYLQHLRSQLAPGTQLDLLTRKETENIPKNLLFFDSVYSLGGGRNTKLQLFSFLRMYPGLLFQSYDVLLDLQNHKLSRVIRFLLGIRTYSVFDRTSSNYAGDRYKNTINALGIWNVKFQAIDRFKELNEDALLSRFNLKKRQFIVINPAGAFENRNWETDHYISFCKLWLEQVNKDAKFLILGITKIKEKARYIKNGVGEALATVIDKTTPFEALLILRNAKLVISEDSGLLHMSYITGTPTVGILGSTRNDWTNPNLMHTYFFNSSDLPCGNCMLSECSQPETICLARVNPADVLDASVKLLGGKINSI